ncbi:hypothetical protein NQ315_008233 [Exocentrus adspersus]|uniref:Nuclease HARBI1 n=1 Tax=Exocentrus adspersus TaxID=1586481 RepID=A0AAV8VLX7_9CUCU|nr:hypothetical protein NQ315_008233 [Exocentrus adspersus]
MDIEEAAVLLALLVDEEEEVQRKKPRIWIHTINIDRKRKGEFHTMFEELKNGRDQFLIYFRMTLECFEKILRPTEPAERLAVTLRYLTTGDSFKTIGHSFRMGFRTVSAVVLEVCTALWNRMQPLFMPEPTTDMWEKSINDFYERWQFPKCLGSIDGKHCYVRLIVGLYFLDLIRLWRLRYLFLTVGKPSGCRFLEESAENPPVRTATPLPVCFAARLRKVGTYLNSARLRKAEIYLHCMVRITSPLKPTRISRSCSAAKSRLKITGLLTICLAWLLDYVPWFVEGYRQGSPFFLPRLIT